MRQQRHTYAASAGGMLFKGLQLLVLTTAVTLIIAGYATFYKVRVENFPENITVANFPASTSVNVENFPATVNVSNFPPVACPVTVNVTNVPMSLEVSNFPTTIEVSNFPTPAPLDVNVTFPDTIEVSNFPTTIEVSNFPTPAPLDVNVTFPEYQRVLLYGQNDNMETVRIPVTSEGHVEVAIHDPVTAFGSVLMESFTPVFQGDAVYGINLGQQVLRSTGTGVVSASDSSFSVSSGTTADSCAALFSRKRLRYRAGEGLRGLWTALYTPGVVNSRQFTGLAHPEDGIVFGYNDTTFGIMHYSRGRRTVRTLTITTASSTAENIVVTLGGVAHNIAVTASGNIQRTVYEISIGTYPGWVAEPNGATVRFLYDRAQPVSGTFSVSGTTVVGSFATTRAGQYPTENFVPQAEWNVDTMDGNGPSGVTLDPTKYNVYGVSLQYLGAGAVKCFIETTTPGKAEAEFPVVHSFQFPNTRTISTFSNPSFPFMLMSWNRAGGTDLVTKTASYAGFIEGKKQLTGNRFAFSRVLASTVTSAAYHPFFTIRSSRVHAGVTHQGVVQVVSVNIALQDNQPAQVFLFRSTVNYGHNLGGNPNFAPYATYSGILYDESATSFTITDNTQLVWSATLGGTGTLFVDLLNDIDGITLQPGESLTLCGRSITGTAAYMTGALVVKEDT